MDFNNRNDSLDDVLAMFRKDQGSLTDSDRYIPENEIEEIRTSAWLPDVPFLEDGNGMEQMKNNYVEVVIEQNPSKKSHVMSRRSGSSSEDARPPRRQCTLRRSTTEDSTPPSLHYTYQDEIALEMDRMRVTQDDSIPETEDGDDVDDEEEDVFSESSSSASSSSSEYQPGPSSPRGRSVESNAKDSKQSPEAPPRRLRKKQKMQMTKEDLEKRRREANKKNSKNYNANKKMREQFLIDEYARKRDQFRAMSEKNSETEARINEYYMYIREYMQIPAEEVYYICEEGYYAKRQEIDAYFMNCKNQDRNLRKLYQNLCHRKRLYNDASKDMKTKRAKTNTYGSRKSRALHSMNIAEHEYKVAELDLKLSRQQELSQWMATVLQELWQVFGWKNVVVKYESLPLEVIQQIDGLVMFGMQHELSQTRL